MSARSELPRRVAAANVGARPLTVEISASPDERRALAERFGLAALDRLEGRARLSRGPARGGGGPVLRVEIAFAAEAAQTCVVTLEPAPARLAESGLVVEFVAGPRPRETNLPRETDLPREVVLPPEGGDPPEPLEGDSVDVGELLAQQFGLALDPYPRAPGAEFAAADDSAPARPFAALAALRGGRSSVT